MRKKPLTSYFQDCSVHNIRNIRSTGSPSSIFVVRRHHLQNWNVFPFIAVNRHFEYSSLIPCSSPAHNGEIVSIFIFSQHAGKNMNDSPCTVAKVLSCTYFKFQHVSIRGDRKDCAAEKRDGCGAIFARGASNSPRKINWQNYQTNLMQTNEWLCRQMRQPPKLHVHCFIIAGTIYS